MAARASRVTAALGGLLIALAGCTTQVPIAERTLGAQPTTWVAVVPRAVRSSPEFARLVETRKRQYTVEIVEYDPDVGTPAQRLDVARTALNRVGAPLNDVAGYVLLIGGPNALSMGPWHFEHVRTPVLTDFALGAQLDTTADVIPAAEWRKALEQEPRWLVGRIPFDEPALAVRVIERSLAQMDGADAPTGFALLGSGGIAEAWLLASTRNELRQQGWNATLVGSAGSCDAPAPKGVLPEWDRQAPTIVVLAAQPTPSSDGIGLRGMMPSASAREPATGTSPALLAAFASSFGEPTNPVLRSLFEDGWSAGTVAFTAPVSASPLGAAWRMSVLLPADLASGAPLGNATEASRRRYWAQAGQDLGMLLPGTDQWRATNSLSVVAYGDPALRAANSPSAVSATSHAPGLPLVIDEPTTAATANPAAPQPGTLAVDGSLAAGDAGSSNTRWYALGALGVFLVAFALWLLSRKR